MAVNYLQYISRQTNQSLTDLRFLVSGADGKVRQVVGHNILAAYFACGKTLFVLDNTKGMAGFSRDLCGYHVLNALSGEVCLCCDLLEVDSVKHISRLRTLLSDLGFDGTRAMKVITYLSFVKETERRLGNDRLLSIDVLKEYSGTMLVKWKLDQLSANGIISQENYEYLLGRYAEVSGAAADFETFLVLFAPFLGEAHPRSDTAVRLPVGEFASDRPMQKLMCTLMLSYITQHPSSSAVLILDDGKGDRSFIIDAINSLPATTNALMISDDVFSLSEAEQNVLINTFPVRIYSRHEDMASCGKIELLCGQIDVIKRASSVSIDRRFKTNSAWDMLFGTNRTDTEIQNAPSKESRFRKEAINSLYPGTAIIDCGGNKALFAL